MELSLNFIQTIIFLIFLLFIDNRIQKRFRFFRKYFIPSLFIGGCLISFLNFIFEDFIIIRLDQSLSTLLVTLFFASIGLRYTHMSFLKGMSKQMLYLLLAIIVAICQNIFVIMVTKIVPATKVNIMIHGSMMLMGDVGLSTKLLANEYIEKLYGIETFTIICGTIACSFTFKVLSRRKEKLDTIWYTIEDKSRKNLIIHLIILGVITIVSFGLSRISLFSFLLANGIAYMLGLLVRWSLDKYSIYKIDNGYVNKLGNYFLSMFIMLKFSSMNISALRYLDLINIIILLSQILLLMVFSYCIVYKFYKKNTLAVYVSAALMGYSIGIPPSTMSVLQHVGKEKGTLHQIVLIVPVVGAWLITLINPYIIKFVFK